MDEESGVCGCGAFATYYGADPYQSEMCWTYWNDPQRWCGDDCDCWDERWLCEECYDFSLASI